MTETERKRLEESIDKQIDMLNQKLNDSSNYIKNPHRSYIIKKIEETVERGNDMIDRRNE